MNEISKDIIQDLCTDKTIKITQHLFERLRSRNIKYMDVKKCIMHGEIIEYYPNDYPYPSCLILGYLEDGDPLHVVVGVGEGYLWIVTAYRPDNRHWRSDLKTRKENE